MDEKRNLELMLLENIEDVFGKKQTSEKIVHSNQTNPMYKKLASFKNSKIGKFSVKDLLKW